STFPSGDIIAPGPPRYLPAFLTAKRPVPRRDLRLLRVHRIPLPGRTGAGNPSISFAVRLVTDLIPFCVNCGKAKYSPAKNTDISNKMPNGDHRWVSVFHATSIAGW